VTVTVGCLSNLSNLLIRSTRQCKSTKGYRTGETKGKTFGYLGGRCPFSQDTGIWDNFKLDPVAILKVSKIRPTLIIVIGDGNLAALIKTGSLCFNNKSKTDLVARSYDIFLGGWSRDCHHSADLIAVYVAVRGYKESFKLDTQDYNYILKTVHFVAFAAQ